MNVAKYELPHVKKMAKSLDHAYFDGACEPVNPGGWCGWGYAVFDANGDKLTDNYGVMRPRPDRSNNVAEYAAAGAAVKGYRETGRKGPLLLMGDSMLVVMQMRGVWRTRESKLYYPVYQRLQRLLRTCSFEIKWHWVPRDMNSIADELSKRGLAEHGIEPTDWSKR